MLGIRILKLVQSHCLTIALFAGLAGGFTSCASQRPATALVSDPDARGESSVPWNRPANWEGKGDIPTGISSASGQDPFGQSGNGGTGGY